MAERRLRGQAYTHQRNNSASGAGTLSPLRSPAHHRSSSGTIGVSNARKIPNRVAAIARMEQVMATQTDGSDDDDGDRDYDDNDDDLGFSGMAVNRRVAEIQPRRGSAKENHAVSPQSLSPLTQNSMRNNRSQYTPLVRRAEASAHPTAVRSPRRADMKAPSQPQTFSPATVRSPRRADIKAPTQPPTFNPTTVGSPRRADLKAPAQPLTFQTLPDRSKQTRTGNLAYGDANFRLTRNLDETSDLEDEVEVLQEENEELRQRIRDLDRKTVESWAKIEELENQVASLAAGIAPDPRFLRRREEELGKREDALRVLEQKSGGKGGDATSLRLEEESAREEALSAAEQLREAKSEVDALRSMTQRMLLGHDEMEEVVLKRCWVARYWELALRLGIYPEVAETKYEQWSSLAPCPFELVISAGEKASQEFLLSDEERKSKVSGEGNIECMLAVEMALREMHSLKVEEAVALALSQHRRPNLTSQLSPDFKPSDDLKIIESLDLTKEEEEDVLFKQAWLLYFWKRAKVNSVEDDIAESHRQLWMSRDGQPLTTQDAVDVERGLLELRKMGIERELWESSRREVDQIPTELAI